MYKDKFDSLKKSIKDYTYSNSKFLHNGSILGVSEERTYTFESNILSVYALYNVINQIYDITFNSLMNKCSETIHKKVPNLNTVSIVDTMIINSLSPPNGYIFFSEYVHDEYFGVNISRLNIMPAYYYSTYRHFLYSPLVIDEPDRLILYVVNHKIQNLSLILENMKYERNGNIHKITFPVYECDYNVYKVTLMDTSIYRNERIDSILT